MDSIRCPNCNSSQIHSQQSQPTGFKGFLGKSNYGTGDGFWYTGSNRVMITCLSCGYEWSPGNYAKEVQRLKNEKEFEANQLPVLLIYSLPAIFIYIGFGSIGNGNYSKFAWAIFTILFVFILDIYKVNKELRTISGYYGSSLVLPFALEYLFEHFTGPLFTNDIKLQAVVYLFVVVFHIIFLKKRIRQTNGQSRL